MRFSCVAIVITLAFSAVPSTFSTPVPERDGGNSNSLPSGMQKQAINNELPYDGDMSPSSVASQANATQPASAAATTGGVSVGSTSRALSHSPATAAWSAGALTAAGLVFSFL
ncbi:hypothetical protein CPB83DRAFT_852078 [Crepidotus variabilis]|uniref:Uncharacterized protein n=1 Tax=Crepidotus variabilis TaxID=179855 RepID=A0A9P6EJD5_9AGAR|nr:hypothetical protein CPB83DRAFT_852078 [Crepidotus variabilis]